MILVALPAVVVVAATVSAFFGRWVWWLDLVANFRPQLGVAAVVFGVTLMVGRWRRLGTATLAAGLVNAALVAPLFIAPSGPGAEGVRVRVVTFNVFASNDRYEEVIGYLRGVDADVVFLHETSAPWEEALEDADLPYEVFPSRSDELIFGTLVLARPGAKVVSYGFAPSEPRAVEVELPLDDGRTLRMLGVHTLAPTTERRAALRDAQLRFAGEWAAARRPPLVVAGDLNAGPWSWAFARMAELGDLQDSARGFGLQLTFPATANPALRVPIDHLLHSEGVTVVGRRLGPRLGSDHFPLVVDLAVNP